MTLSPKLIAELLPCPMCDAPARWVRLASRVKCTRPSCGTEGGVFELERQGITAWNTRHDADALREALELDAARFRALMRCPRIKMQGSAGVNPKTGERLYPEAGSVHFGAEFWPTGNADPGTQCDPTWGRHALHALADDILAVEARAALHPLKVEGDD